MVHVVEEPTALLRELASFFVTKANEAIAAHGDFNVALSGGNSPKKLYELLASAELSSQVAWDKVNFFFGDERLLPADSPDSNALMVRKALFEPLQIPENQIFQVNTTLPPAQAAQDYAERIQAQFSSADAVFDLVLLGLGDDAHTASLFPGTSVLEEQAAGVKEVYLEQKQVYRITLTAPLINKAKAIAFLVYGASKATAVQQVLEGEKDTHTYPAQLIKGNVHWFLDKEAASLLKK
ncbi:6-phosphogluconolactonase [Pontibacter akesuensis]|uniref:6-phosphogluconolactonase n=1 Tax=Pontibacter akesuensis TaxID=388950 RepID=A0A1I7FVG1_9BACT|nr:6-phosphogluconolactonase [Pontibacter akesuensis]GHA60325.1 6-phosphogluconolactonase [Pontibacter akesuensis]SFU40120.1 6-phosphogluconolactonase [Pontibacter akesuensis]